MGLLHEYHNNNIYAYKYFPFHQVDIDVIHITKIAIVLENETTSGHSHRNKTEEENFFVDIQKQQQ